MLTEYNYIGFEAIDPDDDLEEISLYEKHPDTSEEIKECLKDIKVLNAKDFKTILKWRMVMRKFASLEKEVTPPEPIELTEEQKYNLMQQEIEDKLKKEARRRKKKMKAHLKKIQKMRLKLGIANIEDEFEAPTDTGLFHISSIRKQEDLTDLTESNQMDIELKILEQVKKQEQPAAVIESDSEYSDPDVGHDLKTEKYLDIMYENYIRDNQAYRKKLAARLRKEKKKFEIPENLSDFGNYLELKKLEDNLDDIDDYEVDNELIVDPNQSITKRASIWFDSPLFAGIDDEEEETIKTNKRKLENTDDNTPNAKIPRLDKEDSISPDTTISNNKIDEDAPFEEVPREPDEELSIDDYDIDDKAEILALGKIVHDPIGRNEFIDSTSNRYMFPDDGSLIPEWFKDDEDKHNKPQLPITKEMVAQYKEELKAIDSRSTKKVAEAKARKRKRYLEKLQKARSKAKSIVASADLTERDKIKQIQKLYKGQLSKVKPQKVYVVGRKVVSSNIPKGRNVRMKLVDPRLKKDKRGKKSSDNRKNSRSKKKRKNNPK